MPGISLEHLDRSVRPCDDFFRFANGTWLREFEIPAHERAYGAFAEIRDRNKEVLHAICEEVARDGRAEPGSARQLVGDLYASGMDEAAIERAGPDAIADELAALRKLGEPAFPLARTLGWLNARRVPAPFALAVLPDARDPERYLFQLQQAGLGLPDRDHYLKDDERSRALREKYVAHVARMFELLGDDAATASRGARAVMEIETRFARAWMPRVEQRDPYRVYNKRSAGDLLERVPAFWSEYFGGVAQPLSWVNERQPGFVAELEAMAREIPSVDWTTYLRWHVVHRNAPFLSKAFVEEDHDFFHRALEGVPELQPRWKRVVDVVDQRVGEALGQLYVERAFPPQAKQKVLALVGDLRAALADRIRGLEWMGGTTKERALEKLAAFRVKMGYPDTWRDYSGLAIDRGSYARNVANADLWESRRQLRRADGPVDREEWRMTPPTVNAYYSPGFNEIVFPAGILQPPLFDPAADDAVNYGAIGMVIGHEMTHGFDDAGSKYDARGELREWWTPEDRAAYEVRTALVVRQYDGYEGAPGQNVNGKLTLGENIADLGGLKIAYAAFRRSLGGREPAPIDGFTADQRFFLGFAQGWRSKWRDEAMRVRLTVDPHSPPSFRCNGPASNLPEFYAAFGCDTEGPMHRPEAKRPTIW
ncbi:MAG TPA: M13 family metallopeptidase [Candidatus Limnocylindria bacterium]|nr:M13 family metallopeptidase [Candidatus Limnocylindria bacterium]